MHRPARHHRTLSVQRSLLLLVSALASACAKATIRPMPAMPDLSEVRTYDAPGSADTLPASADTSAVDDPPTIREAGPLRFPPDALAHGLQGWVVLDAVVGIDGRVEPGSQRLVALSDSVFLAPAVQSLLASRFTPGIKDGMPVRVLVRQPIVFEIRKSDQ